MRYTEILSEDELFEINMGPKNLRKLVKDLPDALVGLEFEMIVPGVELPDEEGGTGEADYDYDEPCNSIDDIIDFFCNQGTVHNDERPLRRALESSYQDWMDEKLMTRWDNDAESEIREYIENSTSIRSDREAEFQAEHPEATDEDAEHIGNDTVEDAVADALTHGSNDPNYEAAFEQYQEDFYNQYHEEDWLYDEHYRHMTDIHNHFDVTWPYYSDSEDSHESIREMCLDFMNAIGDSKIAYSGGYHDDIWVWDGSNWHNTESSAKPDDCFTIEPDGSLRPGRNEEGLEFVSPPVSVDKMRGYFASLKKWANKRGVYTGKEQRTGLHMNISVPGYSQSNLDYVKLVLLLGDVHVLEQFDRLVVPKGQTNYAESSFEILKRAVSENPDKVIGVMQQMRNHFNKAASKALHDASLGNSKYTSIHLQKNRVEFRGPGNNYLQMFGEDPNKVLGPLMRFVVALDAACDPDKYRKEYQKKLYKFLQPSVQNQKDLLDMFVSYSGGEGFDRSTFKDLLATRNKRQDWIIVRKKDGVVLRDNFKNMTNAQAQTALEKLCAKNKVSPVQYELRPGTAASDDADNMSGLKDYVVKDASGYAMMFQARDVKHAMERARDRYPSKFPNIVDVVLHTPGTPTATPLHQVYMIYNVEGGYNQSSLTASNDEEAKREFSRWVSSRGNARYELRTQDNTVVARYPEQATAPNGVPMWAIYRVSNNEVVHTFAEHPSQSTRSALTWLRDNGFQSAQTDFRIRPLARNETTAQAALQQRAAGQLLSQTDVENRLGWGSQSDDANYQVVRRSNMQPVFLFIANTMAEAAIKYAKWLEQQGIPEDTEDYGFRAIPHQTSTTQSGGNHWFVITTGDDQEVSRFRATDQAAANDEARRWLAQQDEHWRMVHRPFHCHPVTS